MFGLKKLLFWFSVIALTVLFTACGHNDSNKGSASETDGVKAGTEATAFNTNKPVTLSMAVHPGWFSDEEFEEYVVRPAKNKFPNITIEKIALKKADAAEFQDLIAAGSAPDIVVTSSSFRISELESLGLAGNIEDLIKKFNFDTNRIDSAALSATKAASGGKFLQALPHSQNFTALYYNKDIFDKFGVAYPTDGMTWDDAIELARKVTRTDGGVQYRGLLGRHVNVVAGQMAQMYVDNEKQKAVIDTPQWKEAFELDKRIVDIPGNEGPLQNENGFMKDRTVAMNVSINSLSVYGKAQGLNWDLVTLPVLEEQPGIGTAFDGHCMVISPKSKNRDAAFAVVETVLSDEVQADMAQNSRVPVVINEKTKTGFGSKADYLKGKNLAAIFKLKAGGSPTEPYGTLSRNAGAGSIVNANFNDYLAGKIDVNTALRQAEDQINQAIAAALSK